MVGYDATSYIYSGTHKFGQNVFLQIVKGKGISLTWALFPHLLRGKSLLGTKKTEGIQKFPFKSIEDDLISKRHKVKDETLFSAFYARLVCLFLFCTIIV